jgi:hypothetical protein
VTDVDSSGWSGEGAFTQTVIDRLKDLGQIAAIKVEDAPATRSEADYNFLSNEIFVTFATVERRDKVRRFGMFPGTRVVLEKALNMADLTKMLEVIEAVGPSDYADEGMIQYLRTERVIPPYQTRGYKLVELVRIYETGGKPYSRQ